MRNRVPDIRVTGLILALALALFPAACLHAEITTQADKGGWVVQGGARCLVVDNRGADSISEVTHPGHGTLRRAGTWRGREGRYVVVSPGQVENAHIRIGPVGHAALEANHVAVAACPPGLDPEAAEELAVAMDLRLRHWMGEEIAPEQIEQALTGAANKMDAAGLQHWQAEVRFEIAAFLRDMGRLEEAAEALEDVLFLYRRVGDLQGQAAAANLTGLVAWRQGEREAAEQWFEQALDIRSGLGEHYRIAEIANNLGLLASDAGRHQDALGYLETALTVFQGRVDLRAGIDPRQASELSAQFRGDGDLPAALNTLNNLANQHSIVGNTDIAERYGNTVLAFEAQQSDVLAVARARHNLAALLRRKGRLDEALLLQMEALEQFERASSQRWLSEALHQLGQLYALIGDYPLALEYARRAVSLEHGDVRARIAALHQMGLLQMHTGRFEQAEQTLTEASMLSPSPAADWQAWMVQSDLARIYLAQQRFDAALENQLDAYERLAGQGTDRLAAVVELRIAEIRLRQGHLQEAERLLQKALPVLREHDAVFEELEALDLLAEIHYATSRASSIETGREALKLVQRLRALSMPPIRQAQLLANTRRMFDRQIEALIETGQVEAAWETAEQARGRALEQLRLDHDRRAQTGHRQRLLDQYAKFVASLHWHTLERGVNDADRSRHETTIGRLQADLDRVQTDLIKLDRQAQQDGDISTRLVDVQAALEPGQVLLSYHLGSATGWLWIIETGRVRVESLGSLDGARLVSEFVEHLRHPRNAPGRIARLAGELGDWLLAPAADRLEGADEVLVQADGVLHAIPFRLLKTGDGHGGAMLAQQVPLRHLLAAIPGNAASSARGSSHRRLLVLAHPDFDGGVRPPRYPESSLLNRLVRGSGLASLPGTRLEAAAIAKLGMSSLQVTVKTGIAASRSYVLEGGLAEYPLLHIATHGVVDLEYPELSALLLADPNGAGPAFLRPHEIAELDLNAELVVLSACDTGHGRIFAGSGAFSLARPFLVAGARQVLASLWKVDDHRTAIFMQRFYRHLLADSMHPAAALAHTQRWMQTQPATAHPYYWAGFVLTSAGL